jgi:hypothetical protein
MTGVMTGGSGLSKREGERVGLGRLGVGWAGWLSGGRPSWASGLFLLFIFFFCLPSLLF